MEAPYSIFVVQIRGLPSTLRHVCQFDAASAIKVYHFALADSLLAGHSKDKYSVKLFELRPDNYTGYVVDLKSDDTKWNYFLVSKDGVCLGRDVEWERFLGMQSRGSPGRQKTSGRKPTPDPLSGPSQ